MAAPRQNGQREGHGSLDVGVVTRKAKVNQAVMDIKAILSV